MSSDKTYAEAVLEATARAEGGDPSVEPITSLADARERLRLASRQALAVSDWLGKQYTWNSRAGRWCDLADRIGNDARTLAHSIRLADDGRDDD
jgi:hypothetical protein